MATTSRVRRGPFARLATFLKRMATFVWGPAELPTDVDPIVALDRERGIDPRPLDEPHPSERQQSLDRLPRGHE